MHLNVNNQIVFKLIFLRYCTFVDTFNVTFTQHWPEEYNFYVCASFLFFYEVYQNKLCANVCYTFYINK